jgi:hypothetical protein
VIVHGEKDIRTTIANYLVLQRKGFVIKSDILGLFWTNDSFQVVSVVLFRLTHTLQCGVRTTCVSIFAEMCEAR